MIEKSYTTEGEKGMNANKAEAPVGVNNYFQWNLGMFPIEQGKRILDLGCGPGTYYPIIKTYSPIHYFGVDYSTKYLTEFREVSNGCDFCETLQLDLASDQLPDSLMNQQFDYALYFDTLEHIKDHEKVLMNIHRIMKATGAQYLFLKVPALQFLYGVNDEAIGHFRRYSIRSISELLNKYSFRIRKIRYHNMLAVIPWFYIGRIAKRSVAASMDERKLFDQIVPVIKILESIIPPPLGVSINCICSPVEE
jgi:SAM-dependent methyltransferase